MGKKPIGSIRANGLIDRDGDYTDENNRREGWGMRIEEKELTPQASYLIPVC